MSRTIIKDPARQTERNKVAGWLLDVVEELEKAHGSCLEGPFLMRAEAILAEFESHLINLAHSRFTHAVALAAARLINDEKYDNDPR